MAIKTFLCGSALAVSAALALPSAATAQILGLATASPTDAIFGAKAWIPALNQINTTYKATIDQANSKQQQRQTLLAQLDTNGDKQVDDAELQAAQNARNPVLTQIATLENDIQGLSQQLALARAFVLDTLATRYATAQLKVITDRKISLVLTPGAFVLPPPALDITDAVKAEIDRILPVVATVTPPTGWQPTQQSVQLLQQWQDFEQAQLQQQQAAAAQRPAGTPPAAAARPAVPAAGTPARPAVPAAGTPARPATQQPSSR